MSVIPHFSAGLSVGAVFGGPVGAVIGGTIGALVGAALSEDELTSSAEEEKSRRKTEHQIAKKHRQARHAADWEVKAEKLAAHEKKKEEQRLQEARDLQSHLDDAGAPDDGPDSIHYADDDTGSQGLVVIGRVDPDPYIRRPGYNVDPYMYAPYPRTAFRGEYLDSYAGDQKVGRLVSIGRLR